MAGKRGKSGRTKRRIYHRVFRIALMGMDSDLLPFFKSLEELPRDRRNAALLAAIRGGAATAQQEVMSHRGSAKVDKAINAILDAFDDP